MYSLILRQAKYPSWTARYCEADRRGRATVFGLHFVGEHGDAPD
jgi:hypothetical protein